MTKLISTAQFGQIRSALNDVIDTFMELDVTLIQPGEDFSKVGEETEESPVETILKGLKVAEESSEDLETDRNNIGSVDKAEAEVYFGFDYLKGLTPSLIGVDNEVLIDPDKDSMRIDGVIYRIIGAASIGPVKDLDVLVLTRLKRMEEVDSA